MKQKEKPSIVRHFTSVENLFKILDNGLMFSDASQWDDENDRYGMMRYKELQNGNNVLVLCFCDGKGNAYHWMHKKHQKADDDTNAENNKKYGEIQCSIDINKNDLFNYIEHMENVCRPQEMKYCRNAEIQGKDIDDIPYLKRKEYEIEKEIRVLYIGTENKISIQDINQFIHSITLESIDVSMKRSIIQKLKEYKLGSIPIKYNGYVNSEIWKQGIDTIINNAPGK